MTYPNETKLGIFIIEDDKTFAEYLKQTLKDAFQDAHVDFNLDFDKGISLLKQKRPDILILDLYRGDLAQMDLAGGVIWGHIWSELFIPIIIYTAYTAGIPDLEPKIPQDHPFISYICKGGGSDKEVVARIRSYQPRINALRAVAAEIDKTTQVVLRDVSPLIWGSDAEEHTKNEVLVRSARRRLGALMDLATMLDDKPLQSWEQYIVPPLGKDLLMGDIIRELKMDKNDPAAYRLVLSPSCDLVRRGSSSKLQQALVAKCSKIINYTKACSLAPNTKPEKLKEILSKALTNPQTGGILALPGFPSFLPPMAACLRDIDLINLAKIAYTSDVNKNFEYERVASVDSPFREQISWAFLQIACRPGLPERDFDSLIKEIQEVLSDEKK